MFKQHKGLPIGGHLSAALCELVALRRELLCWPAALASTPTARYRDNFFVTFTASPTSPACVNIAELLSTMLGMPVKWVSAGSVFRCLELRITVEAGQQPRVAVVFRTDADRQGVGGCYLLASPDRSASPPCPQLSASRLGGKAAPVSHRRHQGVYGRSESCAHLCSATKVPQTVVGPPACPRLAAKRGASGLPSPPAAQSCELSLINMGVEEQ